MAAPTKDEVINNINTNIPDNNSRNISPESVRVALQSVIDYAEGLELGDSSLNIDGTYRRKDDSYNKTQVDTKFSEAVTNAPSIGGNGNWFVNGADTGIHATGAAGQTGMTGQTGAAGINGTNGITPTIGENGNWFFGATDSGIRAVAYPLPILKVSYNHQIEGNRDGSNATFVLPTQYRIGTTKVWKAGDRMTPGGSYDYVEAGGRTIVFNAPVLPEEVLLVEYEEG